MNIWTIIQVVALWAGFLVSIGVTGTIVALLCKENDLEGDFVCVFSLIVVTITTVSLNYVLSQSNAVVEMGLFVVIGIGVFSIPVIVSMICSSFLGIVVYINSD